jgi:hypothetical protein
MTSTKDFAGHPGYGLGSVMLRQRPDELQQSAPRLRRKIRGILGEDRNQRSSPAVQGCQFLRYRHTRDHEQVWRAEPSCGSNFSEERWSRRRAIEYRFNFRFGDLRYIRHEPGASLQRLYQRILAAGPTSGTNQYGNPQSLSSSA